LYVVDRWGNLVPRGVPGELLIGGDGLARGYLNQPGLTGERFGADPFDPDGRVYRSGDLVRWTTDGQLEFLARIDNQVKLRGIRIEPGEIESALLTHPGVRVAAVALHPDARGEQRLVAYLTPAGDYAPTVAELRRHVGELVPGYMVPTAWVVLDEFPLTETQKIDRAALPPPAEASGDAELEFVAAQTATETAVAGMVAEVLGVPRVGRDTNLFDLGGNSLQAMRILSRINKAFGIRLNIRSLYGTATVSTIAVTIDSVVAQRPTGSANRGE
jgi:acyl carrier protein